MRLVYLARHERNRQLVSIRSSRVVISSLSNPDSEVFFPRPIYELRSTVLQGNINADAAGIESAASHNFLLCRPL
jgi:hypothetical protein